MSESATSPATKSSKGRRVGRLANHESDILRLLLSMRVPEIVIKEWCVRFLQRHSLNPLQHQIDEDLEGILRIPPHILKRTMESIISEAKEKANEQIQEEHA